ncbi:MAG: hypothetical protein JNN20_00130 [Betaproteobacteria bacterium]|nr:hypothetical protein [Betaproteobacteria bacterium]
MSKLIRFSALIAALATCAVNPASAGVAGIDGPWSVLVAGATPAKTTDGYYVLLIVSSLDGTTPTSGTTAVKPGKKQIVVDTPATAGSRGPTHKRMELDMAPCMRYFVAGKKSAEASLRWAPEVFKVEPIGECLAEFKIAAPAAEAK